MAPKLVICAFVLFFVYQEGTSGNDLENQWMTDHALEPANTFFQLRGDHNHESLAPKAESTLNSFNDRAPTDCVPAAAQVLKLSEQSFIDDLLYCVNTTQIIMNTKQIGLDILGMIELVIDDIKAALTGLDDCVPIPSENSLKCIDRFIWGVTDAISRFISSCYTFKLDVKGLAKNISDEYDACTEKANFKQLLDIMIDVRNCTSRNLA